MIEIVDNRQNDTAQAAAKYDEIQTAITHAAQGVLNYFSRNASVCVMLTDNDDIRVLNNEMRGIDSATDVLSFPSSDGDDMSDGFLGDIAISVERAKEQAAEYGHSIIREVSFLTVHGMLHLLGYDHMCEKDEKEMFGLQKKILDGMGVTR